MRSINAFCSVAIIAILISGCATTPTPESSTESAKQLWAKQRQANAEILTWSLKAKIGVKSGKKGGSATLNWDFDPHNQHLELYGPFGSGRVRIDASRNDAVLKDTKGREITGETAEQVLQQRLGWHVPFNQLVDWCRGLPGDDATDITIDNMGRLKSLNQGIWNVQYQQYRTVAGRTLPRNLTITSLPGELEIYDDDDNYISDQLSVKVIVKRWRKINSE